MSDPGRTLRVRHPLARLFGALALALVFVVTFFAASASAHAVLLTESPRASGTVRTAPSEVQLTFSENVEVSFGSIKVFNEKGDRVDIGAPRHATTPPHTVVATLPHLDVGAYVVTWRVISADSHPVHGGFTFTVGNSSENADKLAAQLEAQGGGSKTVGVLFAFARGVAFGGIALLLGAATFAVAIRPGGRRRSRADILVWTGWILLFVSTIAAVLLQGPYAGALPLSKVFDTSVVREVLKTRYGHIAEIRLVLLLAALPLLLAIRKTWRAPAWWWPIAAPIGVAIAATPALAGHAYVGTFVPLAVPADTLHVGAMSIWLGGLATLAFIVLDRDPDAGRSAQRFSPVALTSVVVIVVTGVFASWRQVGFSRDAFLDTTYGRLLLIKVAMFIALIALAAWSRRIVRARRPATLSAMAVTDESAPARTAPADPSVRGLRWSVVGELIFGIAILTITALLVNAQPARSAIAGVYSNEFRTPTMLVDLIVDPTKAGPVDMHFYALTPSGGNLYTPGMTAEMSLPSKGIAPIEIPLVRGGPNHFLACNGPPAQVASTVTCSDKFAIPFSGKWHIVIRALRDQFNEVVVSADVDIR
jgi:copper transport protein